MVCPSCQGMDVHLIGRIPDTDIFAGRILPKPLPGGFLCRCDACGLQFRFPPLDKKHTDKLYMNGSEDNWQQEQGRRTDWKIAAWWIRSCLGGGKILDVGCFDGGFLSFLGAPFCCYGIEINQTAAVKAQGKGISIIGNDFSAITSWKNEFDAVVAFDVFEHCSDPLHLLKNMAKATHSSGIVVISTGNTQALSWRFLKSRYWYCTIAEHISFISPEWCERHAAGCGLSLESVERFSHAATGMSIVPRIKQTALNLIYKIFPGAFAQLRRLGWGGKNVSQYPELLNHPPSWMTAKDHFIVKFRKIL